MKVLCNPATFERHWPGRMCARSRNTARTAIASPIGSSRDECGLASIAAAFLEDNLVYPAAQFDVVLCWNLPDYMDESLSSPW